MENQTPVQDTPKQALARAASPMVEYLEKNYHPHATAIITGDMVEVLEGTIAVSDVFEELASILKP
jgi:hypothetical protein